ncbi:MAG: hypothetical protein V7752_20565 [Halopseudomonas sp.]
MKSAKPRSRGAMKHDELAFDEQGCSNAARTWMSKSGVASFLLRLTKMTPPEGAKKVLSDKTVNGLGGDI